MDTLDRIILYMTAGNMLLLHIHYHTHIGSFLQ